MKEFYIRLNKWYPSLPQWMSTGTIYFYKQGYIKGAFKRPVRFDSSHFEYTGYWDIVPRPDTIPNARH